jgi:hypothetical protein
MIEVLSIGDKIGSGQYQAHSRFSKAVNFRNGEEMVAIVNLEIGSGPINLVTRGVDFDTVQSLQIDNDRLSIDNNEFRFENMIRYQSELVFPEEPDPNTLFSNLQTFKEALIVHSPPKSLTLLIDPGPISQFWGNREKFLFIRFKGALQFMKQGQVEKGVRAMRGLGIGLTPSGDDFNAGMMAAYRAAEKIFDRDYSELINDIYASAIGGNFISNAFLRCARDGCFSEIQKTLMIALVCKSDKEIDTCTRELCKTGETSGADWGVGVFMTFNRI